MLARAFLYSVSAGDMARAPQLAAKVVVNEPDNRAARTTLAVEDIKKKDYEGARDQLSKSAQGPFAALTIELLNTWSAVGEGKIDTALADLMLLKAQGGTDSLVAFHRALVFDLEGRDSEADTAYREALKATGNGPRIVEGYGRFLERSGRTQEAKEFYSKLASDTALQPIVESAQARMETGKKPERIVTSPQDGAAEAMFSIAASLTDDSSADVSVLYLRFARYLRSDFDLADILLADRLEAMEKFEEAIDVYHGIAKPRPIAGLRWCRPPWMRRGWKRTTRQSPICARWSPAIPTMRKPGRRWAMFIAAWRNSPMRRMPMTTRSRFAAAAPPIPGLCFMRARCLTNSPTVGRKPKPISRPRSSSARRSRSF